MTTTLPQTDLKSSETEFLSLFTYFFKVGKIPTYPFNQMKSRFTTIFGTERIHEYLEVITLVFLTTSKRIIAVLEMFKLLRFFFRLWLWTWFKRDLKVIQKWFKYIKKVIQIWCKVSKGWFYRNSHLIQKWFKLLRDIMKLAFVIVISCSLNLKRVSGLFHL